MQHCFTDGCELNEKYYHLLFQFFPSYVDNNHVLSGEEPDSIIKIGNPQSLSINPPVTCSREQTLALELELYF
jgi:hypothetical protein